MNRWHTYLSCYLSFPLGLREDLLDAVGVVHGDDGEPLPADSDLRLMVYPKPNDLSVSPLDEWVRGTAKMEPPPVLQVPQDTPPNASWPSGFLMIGGAQGYTVDKWPDHQRGP